MAFTGTATLTLLSKNIVRVTGLSLAAAASGIIGLNGDGGAGVTLPALFPSTTDATVVVGTAAGLQSTDSGATYAAFTPTWADLVKVSFVQNAAPAIGELQITKSLAPNRITITATGTTAPAAFELYIEFIQSSIR